MAVDQLITGQQETKDMEFIGQEAIVRRDKAYAVNYPIARGVIADREEILPIWENVLFKKLEACRGQYQILIAENPIDKKQDRLFLADTFFEKFSADAIAIMNGACLSLFSTGKTKGLVVEIGEGAAHTVPIFEGFALQHAALTTDMAGRDITDLLLQGIEKKGVKIDPNMIEYIKDIKEKMCTIPLHYEKAVNTDYESRFRARTL